MNCWVRGLLTVLFFLLVSVGFSWPLVTDPTQLHISRQFDIYSLVWLVQAVGADDAGWTFARSAWPMGESLNRIDSFVLVLKQSLIFDLACCSCFELLLVDVV